MAGNNSTDLYSGVKDTLPRSVSMTGTVSAVNGLNKKIVGVGTLFTSELHIGDWLYISSEDELRQVENIVNDLELTVSEGFTNAFAGATPAKTPQSANRMFSYIVTSVPATIDGVSFSVNQGSTHESHFKPGSGRSEQDPILIDASSGAVLVTYNG